VAAPLLLCRSLPGIRWTGDLGISAVKISANRGKTWTDDKGPGSTGCVHMNVEKLTDGILLALFRNRRADNIYPSRSADN
jgi:predicted neuraminidase